MCATHLSLSLPSLGAERLGVLKKRSVPSDGSDLILEQEVVFVQKILRGCLSDWCAKSFWRL